VVESPDPRAVLRDAVADRYDVLDEIGHGGMATVYAAHDRRHDARVAIKLLRPELAMSVGGARFLREIQLTARLQHPHILPVLDSGEAGGLPFYIMPFVEGESLAARLVREDRLSVPEAVRIVAEVADGLAHAHAAGVIHRDIKPANILLSHGHAVIADFGVAKALNTSTIDKLTDSGLAMGTVTYMSPEQAGNEKIDGRSDIYALGCVLYEALAGTPPFTGPTAQAMMARHAVDPVPNIRTLRPSVPQALAAVIERALAKVPQDRFDDANAFREAIVHAATMPVTSPTVQARVEPVSRRRWWLWGAAAAAIALAGNLLPRVMSRAPALDDQRVMVFPLVLPGDWKGASTAGEDVATLIGSAMDGAAELRWVDGWQHVSPEQRQNIRLVGASEATAIARAQRCRFVITGRIVARGDSADVALELHDVAGDSVFTGRPTRTSLASESWRAGLAAITVMLPRLIPVSTPDVASEWDARPPVAVANFLQGEAAFRRLQLADALTAFQRAIAADSTFGLAAVRGAQAASWYHRTDEAAALVTIAQRQSLVPRYAHFARGLSAYLDGRADSAIVELRTAIALDSSMVVAWAQLGETYMHLLPSEGDTDSLATMAFSRAYAIDSTAAPHFFHLAELAARRGDRARTGTMTARFLSTAVDTMLVQETQLIAACAAGTLSAPEIEAFVMTRPLPVLLVGKSLASSPATRTCARRAFEAVLRADTAATDAAEPRRFQALLALVGQALMRERPMTADSLIESFYARWSSGRSLYLLLAPTVPSMVARARAVVAQDTLEYGGRFERLPYNRRLWEQGVFAIHDGRVATARSIAATLSARADTSTRLDSVYAYSMLAHVALAMGDTAQATDRFKSSLTRAPAPASYLAWDEVAALGVDRLLYARVLLARGDAAAALRTLSVFDSALPISFAMWQRESIQLRIDAAIAASRPELIGPLRARLAALRTE
jgi:tRNA A-37 threonylcarbamoyl transferase component Bud32/tetratricopeptide (TPR) repeat protein